MANETLKGWPFPEGAAGPQAENPRRLQERRDSLEQELADEKLAQDKKETDAMSPAPDARRNGKSA